MERQIYLDNSATTKICKEALNKYIDVSTAHYGNPSSLHTLGYDAEKLLTAARDEVKRSLNAKSSDVVFVSSGSEANNLAILGRAYAKERYKRGAKIIITDSEHASVSAPTDRLMSEGFKVARISTRGGKIDIEALKNELTADTVLVSFMMVNNETGALYNISECAKIIHSLSPEALFHIDATQSYLKVPFTKSSLGSDMITVSSHKINGPKGVGALIIDEKIVKAKGLSPIVFGGGQEKGLRSGTENVPAIAAFSEAVRIGFAALSEHYEKLTALRDSLVFKLTNTDALREISPTLPPSYAPHILNITLPKIKSETMLHYLSSFGIYVSSGSACSSNSSHKSSALISYGRTPEEADCSIRISFSHENTYEDVDALIDALISGISSLARKK